MQKIERYIAYPFVILVISISYFSINKKNKKIERYESLLTLNAVTVIQGVKSMVRNDSKAAIHYFQSIRSSKEYPISRIIDLEKEEKIITEDEYNLIKMGPQFKRKLYRFPKYLNGGEIVSSTTSISINWFKVLDLFLD